MISSWATIAIIAIIVWGVVQFAKARAGIITDENGNETLAAREDAAARAELEAARRDVADLRERVKVLERIVTDGNTGDAREQARIAAEIEALRALPQAAPDLKEEPKP